MRAVLVVVAWCLIAAGVPSTSRRDERTDPHAQIAAAMVVAKQAARRIDAPDHRASAVFAVVPSAVAWTAPPRISMAVPRGLAARMFVALVVARSSRGPPVG